MPDPAAVMPFNPARPPMPEAWPTGVRLPFFAEAAEVDDEPKRRVRSIISTEKQSRTRLIVAQDGFDLKEYQKNPVVLFNHDWWRPSVGMNVELEVTKKGLVALTEFAPTAFGEELFLLYSGGYMRAWSVGLEPTKTEEEKDDDGRTVAIRSLKHKLIEYSAVPIPANPDAVNLALSQKMIGPETARFLTCTALASLHATPAALPPIERSEDPAALAPVREALDNASVFFSALRLNRTLTQR